MKRYLPFLIFSALQTGCGGQETGSQQTSVARDRSPPAADSQPEQSIHLSAEKAPPTNPANSSNPVRIVPKVTVYHPETAPSAASSAEEGQLETVTLESSENEEEGFAYPETHICIKEERIFVYYLYEPGSREGWLCELRFSHTPTFWFATADRGFCKKRLSAALKIKTESGFVCHCSRPGVPASPIQSQSGSEYICPAPDEADPARPEAEPPSSDSPPA